MRERAGAKISLVATSHAMQMNHMRPWHMKARLQKNLSHLALFAKIGKESKLKSVQQTFILQQTNALMLGVQKNGGAISQITTHQAITKQVFTAQVHAQNN